MDDWGDPWADNSLNKTPSPLFPIAPATTNAIPTLNGFHDDARWDEPEDGFGDFEDLRTEDKDDLGVGKEGSNFEVKQDDEQWQHEPPIQTVDALREEPATEQAPIQGQNHDRNNDEDQEAHSSSEDAGQEGGDRGHEVIPQVKEFALPQPGPQRDTETVSAGETAQSKSQLASSVNSPTTSEARLSTSPSEESRRAEYESPRTSLDEENERRASTEVGEQQTPEADVPLAEDVKGVPKEEDHAGTSDVSKSQEHSTTLETEKANMAESTSLIPEVKEQKSTDLDENTRPRPKFKADMSLISQIFRDKKTVQQGYPELGDTTISSTSARKTWYRLTRPENLRAFNSGSDAEHYLRVKWKGSAIQADVNKTASRWATEDRFNGRVMLGKGSAATFGWDDKPGKRFGPALSRHEKSFSEDVRVPIAFGNGRVADKPLAANRKSSLAEAAPSVHFGWSSSPIAPPPDPSRGSLEQAHPASPLRTPVAASFPALPDEGVWAQASTHGSIDSPVSNQSPLAASKTGGTPGTTAEHSQPLPPSNFVTDAISSKEPLALIPAAEEGEDDWGDMVSPSTPTFLSSPILPEPSVQAPASITPMKLKPLPEPQKDDPVLFKSNIKPMLRSASSEEQSRPKHMKLKIALGPEGKFSLTKSPPLTAAEGGAGSIADVLATDVDFEDDFAVSISEPAASEVSIGNPVTDSDVTAKMQTAISDPLADADFSIFESAPAPVSIATPLAAELTGASKAKIDEAVERILSGLPDLRYMLR